MSLSNTATAIRASTEGSVRPTGTEARAGLALLLLAESISLQLSARAGKVHRAIGSRFKADASLDSDYHFYFNDSDSDSDSDYSD